MDPSPSEKPAVPRPQPVKTIGILNIVFGGLLLVCIPCVAGYMAMVANMDTFMEMENREIQERFQERKKARLADLAKREEQAATDEQKAALRSERREVLADAPPVVPTANM